MRLFAHVLKARFWPTQNPEEPFFLHIGGIDQHRRQQRRRVLFVGNGISLTGRAFAPMTSTSP